MDKNGYINGSDLLINFAGKAYGHCTSHTTTFNSETKERAVKPVASANASASLFKGKSVTGLSVSISLEGLRCYGETENGFKKALVEWAKGKSVAVTAFEREGSEKPYLSGNFVIASIEESAPAQDDVTYTMTLENDGAVAIDEAGITENSGE